MHILVNPWTTLPQRGNVELQRGGFYPEPVFPSLQLIHLTDFISGLGTSGEDEASF